MMESKKTPFGVLSLVLSLHAFPVVGLEAERETSKSSSPSDEITTSQASFERAMDGDPAALSREHLPKTGFGIKPFPLVFASPETSIGVGAGAVMTYREKDLDPHARPHSVSTMAAYTLNRQAMMVVQPTVYFWKRRIEARGDLIYRRWSSQFFGIGNKTHTADRENYVSNEWYFMPWAALRVWRGLRFGVSYTLRASSLVNWDTGGALDSMAAAGLTDGLRSGFGVIADWDSRDHAFFPTHGGWHRIQWTASRRGFGSDFTQNEWKLDFRQFFELAASHILALHWFSMIRSGELGLFDYIPVRIRGVFAGRYQDRVMTSLESEYRFPVWKRMGGALFFGFGSVGKRVRDLASASLHIAGGAGVRFALDPVEHINLRFDLGIGEGGVYPYLQIQEAF